MKFGIIARINEDCYGVHELNTVPLARISEDGDILGVTVGGNGLSTAE